MPLYVTLYKFTQQGSANIKEFPQRIKEALEAAERRNIKVIGVWMTMGEYDLVAVGDAPDEETAAEHALSLARAGITTSQTMRAFTEDEFAALVSKLRDA